MAIPRITKVAGLSFIGFCAAAAVADKVNLNPMAAQVAGFVGALAGTLVARWRSKPDPPPSREAEKSPAPERTPPSRDQRA